MPQNIFPVEEMSALVYTKWPRIIFQLNNYLHKYIRRFTLSYKLTMSAVEQNFEQTLEEQNLEFYYDCLDRKRVEYIVRPELKPSPMSAVGQNFTEILKEQLAKIDPAKLNYQLFEAIQSLPPELREIIYNEHLALKLRQVHKHISKLPLCHNRQRIARMIICFEYTKCRFEGCCFPCFDRGKLHKVSISPPIELIPFFPTIDYKYFLEICSSDCDWHDRYHFYMKCCRYFSSFLLLEMKFCKAVPLRDIFLRKTQETNISISQAPWTSSTKQTWRVDSRFSVWAAKNGTEQILQNKYAKLMRCKFLCPHRSWRREEIEK